MTTATLTLSDFLLARIAEDEAVARGAAGFRWDSPSDAPWVAAAYSARLGSKPSTHIARWDPARVLAECDAKRRIVEAHDLHMHASGTWTCDTGESWWPVGFHLNEETGSGEADRSGGCATLRLLALPCADHPDYREEWRV